MSSLKMFFTVYIRGFVDGFVCSVIIMVDNQEISVAQYFYYKYKIGLRHSDLPCIIERRVSAASKQAVSSYFPMECLDVIKGQRVEIKKQTPDLVNSHHFYLILFYFDFRTQLMTSLLKSFYLYRLYSLGVCSMYKCPPSFLLKG